MTLVSTVQMDLTS